MSNQTEIATLAGGCFWGLEDLFRTLSGVIDTEAGYTGGKSKNPTWEYHPGHAEALQIEYDPEKIDYLHLLDFFFQIHNPTTLNQQGNDRGTSYDTYVQVYNELTAAYNEVRDEYSMNSFGKKYSDLDPEREKNKIEDVKKKYPKKLSEAEPANNEK